METSRNDAVWDWICSRTTVHRLAQYWVRGPSVYGGEARLGPRSAEREVSGLGDIEMKDRGAKRGAEPGVEHAAGDVRELSERLRGQSRLGGILKAREVASLEPGELLAEQSRRDVIEQRTRLHVARGAGCGLRDDGRVVLDLRRRRVGEGSRLWERGDDLPRGRRVGRAQCLERTGSKHRIAKHARGERRRREPARDGARTSATDKSMPDGEVFGRRMRQSAQQIIHGATLSRGATVRAARASNRHAGNER